MTKTPEQLVREALARGDHASWFDPLYRQAGGDMDAVPWARGLPHPLVDGWLASAPEGNGRQAVVIGCGLGDDAEALARHGFGVTAFDLSETAIQWARQRFPDSTVDYRVEDLMALPAAWSGHFDLVLEVYTLQALPLEIRNEAMTRLPRLLAPGGKLLLICIGRDDDEPLGTVPWPLSRAELGGLEKDLSLERFEEHATEVGPQPRHFRMTFNKPGIR